MKNYYTSREIQMEEKKILDQVVNYLDENNIRYFLSYGTMLGAIRHKGFIPWDDDIDISIPRPDYDKLLCLLKKNNRIANTNLFFHHYSLNNLNMPFIKVYNHDINIDDWRYKDKYEKYLWIDLFPVDGLPNNDKELKIIYKKRDFWKHILMYRKSSYSFILGNNSNILKKALKIISKIIFSVFPEKFVSKKIEKTNNKNKYEKSEYSGDFVWGEGTKERFKKNILEDYILVDFEGTKYKGIKNYDLYLSQLYGDYMKLPPIEKRKTHSFKAWRSDDEN